jgi:hypothetical protein
MARRHTNNESVDAFPSFVSDWEILSPEDLMSLKGNIQNDLRKAAQRILLLNSEEMQQHDHGEDPGANQSPSHPLTQSDPDNEPSHRVQWLEDRPSCVENWLFPLATYHHLLHQSWLPESHGQLRILYELDLNHLIVRLASPAHDAAANAFNSAIAHWSSNGGIGARRSLIQLGEAQWRYAAGSEKSPGQSYTPRALTAPPAWTIPGTISCPYPTLVIEVSKTNES